MQFLDHLIAESKSPEAIARRNREAAAVKAQQEADRRSRESWAEFMGMMRETARELSKGVVGGGSFITDVESIEKGS